MRVAYLISLYIAQMQIRDTEWKDSFVVLTLGFGTEIIQMMFHRYHSQACTSSYKQAVDYTWGQLVLLQQKGFVLWAEALQIMGKSPEKSAQLYKTRTATQVRLIKFVKTG